MLSLTTAVGTMVAHRVRRTVDGMRLAHLCESHADGVHGEAVVTVRTRNATAGELVSRLGVAGIKVAQFMAGELSSRAPSEERVDRVRLLRPSRVKPEGKPTTERALGAAKSEGLAHLTHEQACAVALHVRSEGLRGVSHVVMPLVAPGRRGYVHCALYNVADAEFSLVDVGDGVTWSEGVAFALLEQTRPVAG